MEPKPSSNPYRICSQAYFPEFPIIIKFGENYPNMQPTHPILAFVFLRWCKHTTAYNHLRTSATITHRFCFPLRGYYTHCLFFIYLNIFLCGEFATPQVESGVWSVEWGMSTVAMGFRIDCSFVLVTTIG